VSIGTADKLKTFLELNPHVPPHSIFVDDYQHQLYKDLGFSRFDDSGTLEKVMSSKVDKTKLGGFLPLGVGTLVQYVTHVLQLAPVEGTVNWLDLPEGGLRNGGTLVIQGENVIYQWSDTIPSDVPDIQDVIRIAQKSVLK